MVMILPFFNNGVVPGSDAFWLCLFLYSAVGWIWKEKLLRIQPEFKVGEVVTYSDAWLRSNGLNDTYISSKQSVDHFGTGYIEGFKCRGEEVQAVVRWSTVKFNRSGVRALCEEMDIIDVRYLRKVK